MKNSTLRSLFAVLPFALLAACGASNTTTEAASSPAPNQLFATMTSSSPNVAAASMSRTEASRFLIQATFGPTQASIDELVSGGTDAWLTTQFSRGYVSHLGYVSALQTNVLNGAPLSSQNFFESFWKQVVTADNQLRQRVAFALSQLFVVSYNDSTVAFFQKGVANYYDTLSRGAFGNYRDLLQNVAKHPMMGLYLSHLRNEKEDGERLPDENFARELMQLFTIGLYELNQDGTPKLVNGLPVETYTHADVAGLAKVFTGWGWSGPDQTSNRWHGSPMAADREYTPMQMYPIFHSTSEKKFLGVTIPVGSSGDADLKIALDRLFNHPNVGPFVGKQLIQRLVSSNPSPAYVGRVAAAFANNGSGVRGDMQAVIKAILMDPEARQTNTAGEGTSQKVREPILRLANWMRAFNGFSSTGRYQVGNTDDPVSSLAQSPLRSPSVFNFYRPGYVPPGTDLATAGMAAPEMQITNEMAVSGYLNYIRYAIAGGVGLNYDIKPNYWVETTLAATPDLLIDRIQLILLGRPMSSTLRSQIRTAVNSVTIPALNSSNSAFIADCKLNRVKLAIFLTMASAEYIVQK